MEDFLAFVREVLLDSSEIYKKVFWEERKYSNQDIIKALLAFDNLNDQISTVGGLTIARVFQTWIYDIIRQARDADAHEEEDNALYDDISLYYALERTLEDGVFPINSDGEIICKIADGVKWHIVNVVWRGAIYEIDDYWNSLDEDGGVVENTEPDTREKIIARINLIERLLEYHKNKKLEISDEERQEYETLINAFKAWFTSRKKQLIEKTFDNNFISYLRGIREELVQKLKNTKPTDRTMIQPLIDVDVEPWIRRELPIENYTGTPPHKQTPSLRIV